MAMQLEVSVDRSKAKLRLLKSPRHARLAINAHLYVVHHGDGWISQAINISSTGLLILRPEAFNGKVGDDISITLNSENYGIIGAKATVIWSSDETIALNFIEIYPDSELPLWKTLGEFADRVES